MLDEHQGIRPEVDGDDPGLLGLRVPTPVFVRMVGTRPASADWHRRRYNRIKLPSKLEFQEPVKVVHL